MRLILALLLTLMFVPLVGAQTPAAYALVSETYVTSGSGTFNVAAGVDALQVECLGAGGGGAGAQGSALTVGIGTGGGAGARAWKWFASPASSYSYVIGTGGPGGSTSPFSGVDGGATTFGTLTCGGGKGGVSASGSSPVFALPPAAATATGGDLMVPGARAGMAFATSSTADRGYGADSPYGSGSPYGGLAAAAGYGAGGGGSWSTSSSIATGNAGSGGLIIIRQYVLTEPRTLVVRAAESPGANCDLGGEKVSWGQDDDRDGVLDAGEVEDLVYVCDGRNGYDSLVKTTVLASGPPSVCITGGIWVESGLDDGDPSGTARDGILQSGEVDYAEAVCNGDVGPEGPQGPQGETGATGPQGPAGADGADGFDALVETTTEGPGANCAAGGFLVESGRDDGTPSGTARNGVLEAGEVDSSDYVCHGEDGATGAQGAAGADGVDGFSAIVDTTPESAGANCVAGGFLVQYGLDDGTPSGTARNGVLEAGEVDGSEYVCHGEDGATGAEGPAGPQGPAGADGADGVDGYNSLVTLTVESAGANCVAGGFFLQSGLDDGAPSGTARDGVLQAGEVDESGYVCHGQDGATGPQGPQGPAGADGANGFTSLATTTQEPEGANCQTGGVLLETGLDNGDGGGTAGDGILQAGEVDGFAYVCHGEFDENTTFETLMHETEFVEVTGLTAAEFMVFPLFAMAGAYLWSRKDPGMSVFGSLLVLMAALWSISLYAGGAGWRGSIALAILFLLAFGYMACRNALDWAKAHRSKKEQRLG